MPHRHCDRIAQPTSVFTLSLRPLTALNCPPAVWLVAQDGAGVCGLAHARPEALTDATWNLLALAVRPSAQGRGIAAALVSQGEAAMQDRGARLVIVDTAGTADYAAARRLYARLGYAQVARIPDYWAEGVDKITFAKRL